MTHRAGSENAEDSTSQSMIVTAPERFVASDRATGSGPAYPSSLAVRMIRSRNPADSWSGRLYAFDTVALDTPTSRAMVSRVGRRTRSGLTGQA